MTLFRVEAEWVVDDQAAAERLAEALTLLNVETSSSTPIDGPANSHPAHADLADELHDVLTSYLGDCPEVDLRPACFAAAEVVSRAGWTPPGEHSPT